VKVLLDHNVPKKLRGMLAQHEVSTAKEMNWAELENGSLLREAELACFDLMITCDQNLTYQQNLTGRKIALIVLDTNNWKVIQREPRVVAAAIDSSGHGSFQFLELTRR
jgi:hypothetical protein